MTVVVVSGLSGQLLDSLQRLASSHHVIFQWVPRALLREFPELPSNYLLLFLQLLYHHLLSSRQPDQISVRMSIFSHQWKPFSNSLFSPDVVVILSISVTNFSVEISAGRASDCLNQARHFSNNSISILVDTGSRCLLPSTQIQINQSEGGFQLQFAVNLNNRRYLLQIYIYFLFE